MAATDARPVPRKNTAYRLPLAIRKNDGTLITTWAGQDSEVSLDGEAFADCTNEATEIGTSGCGYIDLTADEMNADSVIVKITVTNTDALPVVIVLYPEEAGDMRSDVTHWKGSAAPDNTGDAYARLGAPAGASIAADIVTVNSVADAIKAKTDNLPASPAAVGSPMTLTAAYDAAKTAAQAGDAMTLTAQTIIDLAAAMEAAIINELDGTAVMQAIADLIAGDMTTGDLSVQAIAAATRDVLLDRVLAGNHDLAGTVGKLLQFLDVAVSSRLATSGYTAPDNATISSISSAVTQHRANTEVTLDKLGTMIQLDEASSPQFTTNALEQVPKSGYSLATAPPTAAEIKTALEADGGKLDHVWETTEDNAGVRRFSAAALAESPTAAGAFTDEDRAALAAAKAVTDAIATMIVIDGAVYQFTENALELGPAGSGAGAVNILPLQATAIRSGRVSYHRLTAYQHCRIAATVSVFDAQNQAVDLSGHTLALVAWDADAPTVAVFELRTDGASPELTIGGVSDNQVAIDGDDAHTATARELVWRLYDLTDDAAIADGVLTIESGAAPS